MAQLALRRKKVLVPAILAALLLGSFVAARVIASPADILQTSEGEQHDENHEDDHHMDDDHHGDQGPHGEDEANDEIEHENEENATQNVEAEIHAQTTLTNGSLAGARVHVNAEGKFDNATGHLIEGVIRIKVEKGSSFKLELRITANASTSHIHPNAAGNHTALGIPNPSAHFEGRSVNVTFIVIGSPGTTSVFLDGLDALLPTAGLPATLTLNGETVIEAED